MMGQIRYQISNWFPAFLKAAAAPCMLPFSKSWRKRNAAAASVWGNPFWDRSISLSSLITDPLMVQVAPLKALEHNATELEVLALGALTAQLKAHRIFEIGTFDGRSTRTLAANAPDNAQVFTLNLAPGSSCNEAGVENVDSLLNVKVQSGSRFMGTQESTVINQLFGDSATFDFSPFWGTLDLIFIDGSHDEEYVKSDTTAALKMMAPSGGLIVWHDAPLYGVVRYLSKQMRQHHWPLLWIEGTTLMIGWVQNGRFAPVPLPLRTQSNP